MTPAYRTRLPVHNSWALPTAFALIIGAFCVANITGLWSMHRIQTANRRLVDDAMTRVDLMSRISRGFDNKRLLLSEHVIRTSSQEMAGIEAAMARGDIVLMRALHGYQAIAADSAEREQLHELEAELSRMSQEVNSILELSRINRDVEAAEKLHAITWQVATIDRTLASLTSLTRAETLRALSMVHAWQQHLIVVIASLTLAGTALAIGVAIAMLRLNKRQNRRILEVTGELEERVRELNAFAGRVAHDLRGPLTTISLSASRLSERLPQELGTAAVLRRGVSHMESIIADLLTLSRIDAQTPGMVADPASVTATAADDLRSTLDRIGGSLRVEVTQAQVCCGPGLLRQVLYNLGDNAIKYRREESKLEIAIQGRHVGARYELRVSDNGAGMPPEIARHAFEPFFRGDHDSSQPGTGLGLSIVKRVVEANGGTVSLSSVAGRGTIVTLQLPVWKGDGLPK